MDDWAEMRARMVADQLEARGIADVRVLAAMRTVPRHLFVAPSLQHEAYRDRALPIADGQTISQPYMVARMTEALVDGVSPGRVLEIGTGSGYQAAILSLVAGEVISIERRPELAASARDRLHSLGYSTIQILEGDGTVGVVDRAPYDGIMVTAGAPHVPAALVEQLAEDGRLVVPVGPHRHQVLTVLTRRAGQITHWQGEGCVFVPLLGLDGWPIR